MAREPAASLDAAYTDTHQVGEHEMQIQEIMTRPALSCRATDPMNTAIQLMWEHDCGAVPVTTDDGRLEGIVTDRDACMASWSRGQAPQTFSVGDAMTRQVFTCTPEDSLDVAERLMKVRQVRRLPVVDTEGRLLGMLSMNDLVRAASASRKRESLEHDVLQTLAAISQPRAVPAQPSAPPRPAQRPRATA